MASEATQQQPIPQGAIVQPQQPQVIPGQQIPGQQQQVQQPQETRGQKVWKALNIIEKVLRYFTRMCKGALEVHEEIEEEKKMKGQTGATAQQAFTQLQQPPPQQPPQTETV